MQPHELSARMQELALASDTASNAPRADVILGNGDQAYTFGLNWYANRWIKVQANLVRNTIMFPDQGPLPEQPVFWSRLIRFEFSM